MGFGLVIGVAELLKHVTTANYSAIINSCTIQSIRARAKSSQFNFTSHCLVTLLAGDCLASNPWRQMYTHSQPNTKHHFQQFFYCGVTCSLQRKRVNRPFSSNRCLFWLPSHNIYDKEYISIKCLLASLCGLYRGVICTWIHALWHL
jgi:hypothetical protein